MNYIIDIMGVMNWDMYTGKVIEYFMGSKNDGSMMEPDGEGHFGEPEYGDSLTIYIKVSIENYSSNNKIMEANEWNW